MNLELIRQAFPTFDNYKGISLQSLNELEASFLALHNSGDSIRLQAKLWQGKDLEKGERLFVQELEKVLLKIDCAQGEVIYRHEINLEDQVLFSLKEELKFRFNNDMPFINQAFWNFSAFDWKLDNFRIEVQTSTKSRAKRAYKLYGQNGDSEKELIYLPNTKFKVINMTSSFAKLVELRD